MLDNYGSPSVLVKHRRHTDGEMHVHYHPRYRVVDCNLEALALLHAQFGGSISHHGRKHYSYEIGQKALAEVLRQVLPYMEKKRQHAEFILRLVDAKDSGNDREAEREIVEELRRLNAQN